MSGGITTSEPRLLDKTGRKLVMAINSAAAALWAEKHIEVPLGDVNFYDYDGTVVHSYTAKEFLALQDMPGNPAHKGLVSQGWNWTLEKAQAYVEKYGTCEIGQMYTTDDGKTRLYIRFMMPRYWDGIDVSEKTISIIYGLAGQYYGETAAISAERTDDSLRFGWVVPEEACCIAGTLLFVLVIKDSTYVLKSQITEVPVLKSIDLDDVIPEPTRETWYADFQVRVEQTLSAAENAVEVAQNTLEQARSLIGSPLVANTAAEMTDTSRIYVYTDTTLSIAGKAADAKKTGDEISQIKEDLQDLLTRVTALEG